jgi:hypothetical protein
MERKIILGLKTLAKNLKKYTEAGAHPFDPPESE